MSEKIHSRYYTIPVGLLSAKWLTIRHRLLLCVIDGLDPGEDDKACFARNSVLAERLECSLAHVRTMLTDLNKAKCLNRFAVNGKRHLRVNWDAVVDKVTRLTHKPGPGLHTSRIRIKESRLIPQGSRSARNPLDSGALNGASEMINSPKTKAQKLASDFFQFASKNRWLVGVKKPNMKHWEQSFHSLLKNHDIAHIRKVFNWFTHWHNEPFTPKARAATTFVLRFDRIEAAMKRESPQDKQTKKAKRVSTRTISLKSGRRVKVSTYE